MSAQTEPAPASSSRAARSLLALGAALGLAAAVFELVRRDPRAALPPGAVAVVNGEPIRAEVYQRALAALAGDRRNPIAEPERRHVLDRLIEEELLVQRGLELGLARHDRRVRANLVSGVIEGVVSEASAREPSPDEARAFYAGNLDYFARPGRMRVQQIFIRADASTPEEASRARALRAAQRLRAGESLRAVDAELGDPQLAPVPDALLPAAKLREYLGPTAVRALGSLEVGAVSDPLRSLSGHHVLVMWDREPESTPAFEEIEAELRAEFRRRAGDRALREYLEELRARAQLIVSDELP